MDPQLLAALMAQMAPESSTKEELMESLAEAGTPPEVLESFQAVDRAQFAPEDADCSPYADSPIRRGHLHLSAPGIYAKVLEALELQEGMSFLNIGSGSGYLSALVAQTTGKFAINHGVELWPDNVDHARRKCAELGLHRIQFWQGNCFDIDVDRSIHYDRVYIGAGADVDAKFLFKLCKPGGIVVGPFSVDESYQSLRKGRRRGEKEFAVWDVLPVTFAPLIHPEEMQQQQQQLAPPPKRLVLQAATWTPYSHIWFPRPFKRGVITIIMALKRPGNFAALPKELWFLIFSFLDREWLSAPRPGQLCGYCESSRTSSSCGRCKVVRYCSKDCQRKHWKVHKHTCEPRSPSLQGTSSSPLATPNLHALSPSLGAVSPLLQPAQAAQPFNPVFAWGLDDPNDDEEDSGAADSTDESDNNSASDEWVGSDGGGATEGTQGPGGDIDGGAVDPWAELEGNIGGGVLGADSEHPT